MKPNLFSFRFAIPLSLLTFPLFSSPQKQNSAIGVLLPPDINSIDPNGLGAKIFPSGLPKSEELIFRTNYIVSLNYRTRLANWVAEYYTASSLKGEGDRVHSHFKEDNLVPLPFRSGISDYAGSGYSRGHLACASSHKQTQQTMDDTFFLSNILPQNMAFNGSDWYRLELFSRQVLTQFDVVRVLSGPLFLSQEEGGKKFIKYQVIGPHEVAVPTHFFKIIIAQKYDKSTEPKMETLHASFVMPNCPAGKELPLSSYQVPLETIERQSGLFLTPYLSYSSSSVPALSSSSMEDLCHKTGCKDELDGMTRGRIASWRKLGLLQEAKSLKQLEKTWSKVEIEKMEADWLKKMYTDAYEQRKHFLTQKKNRKQKID